MNKVKGNRIGEVFIMKKIIMVFSIFSILVLLSGCISIPLGDGGTLEVSKDGFSVDEGKEGSNATEDEMIEEDETVDVDVAEPEPEKDAEVEETEKTTKSTNASSSDSCEGLIEDARGNERHIKKLIELTPTNYPEKDCMRMLSVNEEYIDSYDANHISADYYVEGYWADIVDEFVDYLADNGFKSPKVNESATDSRAYMSARDKDFDVDLTIEQADPSEDGKEFVRIRLGLYHYDASREE